MYQFAQQSLGALPRGAEGIRLRSFKPDLYVRGRSLSFKLEYSKPGRVLSLPVEVLLSRGLLDPNPIRVYRRTIAFSGGDRQNYGGIELSTLQGYDHKFLIVRIEGCDNPNCMLVVPAPVGQEIQSYSLDGRGEQPRRDGNNITIPLILHQSITNGSAGGTVEASHNGRVVGRARFGAMRPGGQTSVRVPVPAGLVGETITYAAVSPDTVPLNGSVRAERLRGARA